MRVRSDESGGAGPVQGAAEGDGETGQFCPDDRSKAPRTRKFPKQFFMLDKGVQLHPREEFEAPGADEDPGR